jgi:hypothetical protein
MLWALTELDGSLTVNKNSGLDNNRFYAFPLSPPSGLRNKLWQQISSIFEEMPLHRENENLAQSNRSELAVMKSS